MTYRVHGMGPHGGVNASGLTRAAADAFAEDFVAKHPDAVARVLEMATGVEVGTYGPTQKPLPVSRNFEQRTR